MGEGNVRQVVSGLAKFCSPEELTVSILPQIRENHDHLNIRFKCLKFFFFLITQNRLVVLITNVKPGKLRDVMSAGLVCFNC